MPLLAPTPKEVEEAIRDSALEIASSIDHVVAGCNAHSEGLWCCFQKPEMIEQLAKLVCEKLKIKSA